MLTIFSLDHLRSTVSEREAFALSAMERRRLSRLVRRACGCQVALLVTCNRVELITWADREDQGGAVADILALGRRLAPGLADPFMALATRYVGDAAALHLLRVAAGLESQIEGDVQVLGQVRGAYAGATESGSAGAELHRCFQTALRAGKRVHHETAYGVRKASLGTIAAAEVARHLGLSSPAVGTVREHEVVLLGAGKAAEGAARALVGLGVRVTIVNRDRERGTALARAGGATFAGFEDRHPAVARADAAILATGAAEPILAATALQAARAAESRSDRPLLLIDLGVPRNVDPAVAALPGVTLAGLQDLVGQDDSHGAARDSRQAAEQIIEAEMRTLRAWLQARTARLAGVA